MKRTNRNRQDYLFSGIRKFREQKKIVARSFSIVPKTMLQVSIETGVLRANICRFIAQWQREDAITLIRMGICPISKHRAGFYCINKDILSYVKK